MKKQDVVAIDRVYKFTKREDGYFVITAFSSKGIQLGTKILVKNADEAIQVFAMLNDRGIIDTEKLRQHLEFIKREEDDLEPTQEIDLMTGRSA